MRFVTIYGFVQSNIQHVSPASSPPDPTGVLPQEPAPLSPLSKFLTTHLVVAVVLVAL